jgi:RNA polymerase-binding transcription factor DksA
LISIKGATPAAVNLVRMTPWQLDQLRRGLERRREALIAELSRDAARVREEPFGALAGATPDRGDESVAALLADVDQAELSRDVVELRAVEAARRRLADGSYGICVDCGAEIDFERLLAQPAASRCVECQHRHEKTYR